MHVNVVIKTNKFAHELWHDYCGSHGHNIEHNGLVFEDP